MPDQYCRPEFDMPGHGGWNYGMKEICLKSCPSILDVTQDQVYEVLTNFLSEMAEIFTDPVVHTSQPSVL
jgi:hypothetical protein